MTIYLYRHGEYYGTLYKNIKTKMHKNRKLQENARCMLNETNKLINSDTIVFSISIYINNTVTNVIGCLHKLSKRDLKEIAINSVLNIDNTAIDYQEALDMSLYINE